LWDTIPIVSWRFDTIGIVSHNRIAHDQISSGGRKEFRMAFDPMVQRQIMGRFATGVTVVTTRGEDDHLCGLTANAVASLSLDPPLVLVAVDRRSHSHGCFKTNRCFAINVLSSGQEELSRRFAKTGPKDFSDLAATTAVTGAPILNDTLGYVDCRLVDVLSGGDHDIFIGEIVAGDVREGRPLMFYGGKYTRLLE
jgi:flavin reductase (DIM6/NTAB) family NADH-FMN oxidoreductase RutF